LQWTGCSVVSPSPRPRPRPRQQHRSRLSGRERQQPTPIQEFERRTSYRHPQILLPAPTPGMVLPGVLAHLHRRRLKHPGGSTRLHVSYAAARRSIRPRGCAALAARKIIPTPSRRVRQHFVCLIEADHPLAAGVGASVRVEVAGESPECRLDDAQRGAS